MFINLFRASGSLFFFGVTALLPVNVYAAQASSTVGQHVAGNMDVTSMLLSLLMVLALIIVSALLLKRFNLVPRSNAELTLITSLALGNKEKIVVIQIQDKQLLLGVTGQQITLLDTLEQPIVAKPMAANNLTRSLTSLMKKRELNS